MMLQCYNPTNEEAEAIELLGIQVYQVNIVHVSLNYHLWFQAPLRLVHFSQLPHFSVLSIQAYVLKTLCCLVYMKLSLIPSTTKILFK